MKKKSKKHYESRPIYIEKQGMKNLRMGMLDFLSRGKRILNTKWFSIWWIKK